MRHPIEEAPRDGTDIILEDDASGTYDVAHWSIEAGEWIGQNGEPAKVTPTHWYPMPRDQYLLREDTSPHDRPRPGRARRLVVPTMTVTLAVALIVTYFHADVGAYVTRYAPHETGHVAPPEGRLANQDLLRGSLVVQLQLEADQVSPPPEEQQAAQVQQLPVLAAQQSLKEERAEAAPEPADGRTAMLRLDGELRTEATLRTRALEEEREKASALALVVTAARQELATNSEQHRQALDEERARGVGLARELETVQRQIETQATQSLTAVQEVLQQNQAAESIIAELRQSLQQEQIKTAALMHEAKAAQASATAAAELQRSALEEAQARAAALASELAGMQRKKEVRAAQSQEADDAAAKQNQAAESAIAELQQSLRPQRRTEAMARDRESARRMVGVHDTPSPATSNPVAKAAQTADQAVPLAPAAAEVKGGPEATRLIARAGVLLGRGDIGSARIVLERASETGSAKASFMLAETYDPAVLTGWGTYGTRGQVAKARELYAKAHAGGILVAKNRLKALPLVEE